MTQSQRFNEWLLCLIALLLAAFYLFPLYWMYITSVKTSSEMFANPPTFWPTHPDMSIYSACLDRSAT